MNRYKLPFTHIHAHTQRWLLFGAEGRWWISPSNDYIFFLVFFTLLGFETTAISFLACWTYFHFVFQMYPKRDITNIVESSHYLKIGSWCRVGSTVGSQARGKCKTARWVKPYRCLGEYFFFLMLILQYKKFYIKWFRYFYEFYIQVVYILVSSKCITLPNDKIKTSTFTSLFLPSSQQ